MEGTRALEAKWSRVRLTEATGGQRLKERKVPRRTRCGLCGWKQRMVAVLVLAFW